jgi:hypothetical protein
VGVGRVAVVVAAGVGDKPRGDAAERIANGLRLYEGYDEPVQHAEWYEVPDVAIQPVDRFETGHNGAHVDIYEFWWADLSRFPAASRSFLAAFFGLFLALPSFGRTALRRTKEIGLEPQTLPEGEGTRLSDADYHLLGFLSWIVAVPVVVLSAQVLMTVAALAIAIALPESAISGVIAVGLFGIGTSVVGLLLLHRYRVMSGRRGAFVLGLVALAGATAVCVARLVVRGVGGKSIELALADTVTVLFAYPMRILWLSVLAFVVVVAFVLGVKCCRRNSRDREGAVKRTITAGLTVSLGPVGFAVLMAILSAAVGGLAQHVGPTVIWGLKDASQTPLCLASPDSWTLVRCPTITAWNFGTLILGDSIFALACAFVVILGVLALYLVTLLVGEIVRRVHPSPNVGPPASDPAASRQAARLSFALGAIGGLPAAIVLLLAAFAASYAAAAAWLPFFPLPDDIKNHVGLIKQTALGTPTVQAGWSPVIAGVLGVLVSGLLLAARAMGMSPQQLASDSPASNFLRLILDKPYDIATFLRDPMGSKDRKLISLAEMPRQKMLGRYRALLVFLRARGYDRVVFAAHSQGSVLTATLLHEDELPLPPLVSLLTFGCPLRQLYSERFPSQYAWVNKPKRVRRFVPHVTEQWINVGTAGDPVGRTVFDPVPDPWDENTPPKVLPGKPRLEDVLLGKGGHSSYWTVPKLYERLAALIEAKPG